MRFDVVPDDRAPDRWFWVRAICEKGRAKRLAAYPTRSRAEEDKREREADEYKRAWAAKRRAV